jgi:transcriptional regulator with XRE-family HTH domain
MCMTRQMPALTSHMKELRTFLGLTQKQMAAIASCSVHSLLSIELGRLKLSSRMALKVARATGISLDWLTGDWGPMVNDRGEPYSREDFDDARNAEKTMAFYLAEEEMEILIACDRLFSVYKAARARGLDEVVKVRRAVNKFVEDQVRPFRSLKAQIEQENKERNRRQRRHRSYLFPGNTESFKRIRRKSNEAIAAFSEWEKRTASPAK